MLWWDSQNIYQNNMCLQDVGLHFLNMVTIIGSIVNILGSGEGDVYDHLVSQRLIIVTLKWIVIQTLKIMRTMALASIWIC
jgi:hypothetical protein